MKIKILFLTLFILTLSQQVKAHDLDLKPIAKTIRITLKDVTSAGEEKNMLTFGAAGLILGACKRAIPNRNWQNSQDKTNRQMSVDVISLLGLVIAIAKDMHTGHGLKNAAAFSAGRLAGSKPELLLETSMCLIAGRAIGAAIDKLANDPSKPNRFESSCMKSGSVIGAVFGAANQKKDPFYVLAVGLTSYKLIDCLDKKSEQS